MQGYHFSARKPISRAKGQSAVAKAAYNGRVALRDERTGELKDYSRTRNSVMFSGIFVDPKRDAPEWAQDRSKLWNETVKAETRKDAQEAQEIIIALPHQLTDKGREYIVKDFVRETIMRETGRVADVNIHRPPKDGDERNYHVHILLTMRDIGPDGFSAKKAPEITAAQIDKWKANFSNRATRELRKEGFELEADRWAVGHLAKPEQLKDALRRGDFEHAAWAEMGATKHRGPAATGMDRREPGSSERAYVERDSKTAEIERMKLARELRAINKEIVRTEDQIWHERNKTQVRLLLETRGLIGKMQIEKMQREVAIFAKAQVPEIRVFIAEKRAERDAKAAKPQEREAQRPITRFGDKLLARAVETALNDPRQRNGDGVWSVTAFKDGLEKNRLAFARVTDGEAAESHREAAFAKQIGNYRNEYKAGEIVVIREPGKDGPEANRIHKVDQEKAEDYLRCIGTDANQLQNVATTKKTVDARAAMRQRNAATAKARQSLGPQRGGMTAQQSWANRKAKWTRPKEQDRPLRPDDYAEKQRKERDTSVIDPDRYRTDPDYRRQAQNEQAYKSPEEKKQQRENDLRQLREQRER